MPPDKKDTNSGKAPKKMGSNFARDLFWFLGIIVLLWFVWLYTGGPERAYRQGPFIKPPTSAGGTGETYGNLGDIKILENLKIKSGVKTTPQQTQTAVPTQTMQQSGGTSGGPALPN